MLPAVTLVHKGAMPIAVHAVATFARHFRGRYQLAIHTDGSPDANDEAALLTSAEGMSAHIVRPADRRPVLDQRLADFPRTRALLDGTGYFTKLELPMVAREPYFYFDSDIVWLRCVANLAPSRRPNAFSTETWSWYNGVAHDREWIKQQIPRRVNSGFYFLGESFPFKRMEDMLARGLFDPTIPYNTDQEIMAYLFRDMELYHPEDLKRSRVRRIYNLATDSSAAIHFPGQMWRSHMNQIESLKTTPRGETTTRFQEPRPLTKLELVRMRLSIKVSNSPLFGESINLLRALRGKLSGA